MTEQVGRVLVEHVVASAEEVHAFWPARLGAARLVRVVEPVAPALVLGSTTKAEAFRLDEARRRGYEVARRSSGGGAVLVAPSAQVWLMIYLPRRDPLVLEDIGRSFLWIGHAVAAVLARHGLEPTVVEHRTEDPPIAREICFAGLGFGEVLVGGDKVLGLAQRRTRETVAFQVSLLWEDHQRELALLRRSPADPSLVRSGGLAHLLPGTRQLLTEQLLEALGEQ